MITAQVVGADVHLLHVVAKKDEVKEAKTKLDNAAEKAQAAALSDDVDKYFDLVKEGNELNIKKFKEFTEKISFISLRKITKYFRKITNNKIIKKFFD